MGPPDFDADCEVIRTKAAALAAMDGAQPIPAEMIADALARLERGYRAMWSATGRTISPMITGPSNFPVRRNQKAMASEMKRYEELRLIIPAAIKRFEKLVDTKDGKRSKLAASGQPGDGEPNEPQGDDDGTAEQSTERTSHTGE